MEAAKHGNMRPTITFAFAFSWTRWAHATEPKGNHSGAGFLTRAHRESQCIGNQPLTLCQTPGKSPRRQSQAKIGSQSNSFGSLDMLNNVRTNIGFQKTHVRVMFGTKLGATLHPTRNVCTCDGTAAGMGRDRRKSRSRSRRRSGGSPLAYGVRVDWSPTSLGLSSATKSVSQPESYRRLTNNRT